MWLNMDTHSGKPTDSDPTADIAAASVPRLIHRAAVIATLILLEAARTLPICLAVLVLRGRSTARHSLYRGVVRGLQNLGPTFVKFGQISSTRRDTMSAELAAEMSRLHDDVRPMRLRSAERMLRAAQDERPELTLRSFNPEAVGSGSIACVYRAELTDGTIVALKLKRARIDARMQTDLALMRAAVKLVERTPKMRGMPLADLVAYISAAILGQLDFRREARNVVRLKEVLAGMSAVRVPTLYPQLSGTHCLVFEFIPDLDAQVAQALAPRTRARLAATVLLAGNKLMFMDGFVHCDLHPGNLYLTRQEEVVVLDAGYCVQLPDRVRRLMAEFFNRMASGDGRRCGEIVLESAVAVGPETDTESFLAGMEKLVATTAGPNNRFDMSVFGDGVFELQQRHGIYAASDFAFPLMSLLVLEGTVRAISDELDFQEIGMASTSPADPVQGRPGA